MVKIFFIVFYSWKLFKKTQLEIGMEEDGLNISQRVLAKVDNHLLLSQSFQQYNLVDSHFICQLHHKQCVFLIVLPVELQKNFQGC